jgi:hypothetical protein
VGVMSVTTGIGLWTLALSPGAARSVNAAIRLGASVTASPRLPSPETGAHR